MPPHAISLKLKKTYVAVSQHFLAVAVWRSTCLVWFRLLLHPHPHHFLRHTHKDRRNKAKGPASKQGLISSGWRKLLLSQGSRDLAYIR